MSTSEFEKHPGEKSHSDALRLIQNNSRERLAQEASQPETKTCADSLPYRALIQTAAVGLYDPTPLGDIRKLDHKYDCEIHSTADAVKYANEALKVLGDKYTRVLTPSQAQLEQRSEEGDFAGIGVQFAVSNESNTSTKFAYGNPTAPKTMDIVIPGTPAAKAGFVAGDVLTAVNGIDVTSMPMDSALKMIGHTPGVRVEITASRKDYSSIDRVMTLANVEVPVVRDNLVGKNIAYVHVDSFESDKTTAQLQRAIAKYPQAKGFIVDLRGNGGGFVDYAVDSASLFLKQGEVMKTLMRTPSQEDADQGMDPKPSYVPKPIYSESNYFLDQKNVDKVTKYPDGTSEKASHKRLPDLISERPVVVLTNGETASAAEIFAGALHDTGKATLVGDTTFGKGIGQSLAGFPNGSVEKFTSMRYQTPSGVWPGDANKTRNGIKPDIAVHNEPNYSALSANDKQFQAALDRLDGIIAGR